MLSLPFHCRRTNGFVSEYPKPFIRYSAKTLAQTTGALLVVLGLFACSNLARGQAACPVVVLAANPNAMSAISGSALSLTFRNTSSAAIAGIVFDARFGLSRRPSTLTERYPLDPGKTGVDQWGDNRLLSLLHISNVVTVWPQMVLFADGTNWSDNGTGQCAFHSDGSDAVSLGISAKDAIPPTAANQSSPSDAVYSPANTAAPVGNKAARLTAQQKIALIEDGKASLCTIRTYPPQATITVDGKVVGTSPLSLVLLKAATPRDVYITLPGYKIFYQAIDPNGSAIPIAATLAPLSNKR